ncbi:MAG: molybdate ABC transporter substrate-binding protein [Thermoleophilia bacterium]|nr:molybdate ABC transporter substrate-binding protein [Thermoleophilia bacterium]
MTSRRIVWAACGLAASGLITAGAQAARPAPLTPNRTVTGVTVYAAASLTNVFQAAAPRVRYSFAGSDQLAFQIEQGAPADVYASANVRYPNTLYRKGLVERPRIFAYNVLVVLVPKANPARIRSIPDLARPGVKLVLAAPTVPAGAYARTVLHRLDADAALQNVVSEEPDVRGVVTKVALGEADAGIAYWTDFASQRRRVGFVGIPAAAQPTVAYSVAVTRAASDRARARAFVRYLLSPDGRRWLRRYGFRTPLR